jgi:hypothetical protein
VRFTDFRVYGLGSTKEIVITPRARHTNTEATHTGTQHTRTTSIPGGRFWLIFYSNLTHTYINIHTYIHIYIHACMHTYIQMYIYIMYIYII